MAYQRLVKITDSTVIDQVQYDIHNEILTVLLHNGKMFKYHQVPSRLFGEMISAPSVGEFFNRRIKSTFHFDVQRMSN